jgi:adenylate cyclase
LTRDHRRLAAIVSADVAGYSRIMGADDSGTLLALKAHRRELIDPKIDEYGGRIVKTTGDGLLLEFPSVVDAVRCAVDVQRGMAERNAGTLPDQRLDFRIGINVGDIIIDGDDIHGDGVNVAARLQALAEPGGICASRVVRDQVLDKLSFTFEDLGAQQVKNIARPVEVYRVDFGSAETQTSTEGRRTWRRVTRALGRPWLAAGLLALGLAGIAVWALPQLWKAVPAPTPPPLSVAILPFTASAGGLAEEQFAEALTRDLALGLGRLRSVRVVSAGAMEKYKGKALDARSVGRELNVRYLVAGDVRRDGKRIVVDAQVIEAAMTTQVWSDRLELEEGRLTPDQSTLVAQLTRRAYEAVFRAEVARADKPPAADASAVEIVLYAKHVWARNPASLLGATEATKLYDQALRLDPSLKSALVDKSMALYYRFMLDPHVDHDRLVQEMDELTLRAVNIDEMDPTAWWLRAEALALQWRWEAALEASARAQRLDPTFSGPISQRAELMLFTGKLTEALALVEQALALEPSNSVAIGWPMHTRCRACLALNCYDVAIVACEKSASVHDWWMPHLYLVAAYTHQGQAEKAAAEKAKVLKQRPDISIADFKALRLSDNPAFLQQTESHLFVELRKAGIPEQ